MLHEIKCENCGTLLFKEAVEIGEIEIKCYRCNYMNYLNYQSRLLENLFSGEI